MNSKPSLAQNCVIFVLLRLVSLSYGSNKTTRVLLIFRFGIGPLLTFSVHGNPIWHLTENKVLFYCLNSWIVISKSGRPKKSVFVDDNSWLDSSLNIFTKMMSFIKCSKLNKLPALICPMNRFNIQNFVCRSMLKGRLPQSILLTLI